MSDFLYIYTYKILTRTHSKGPIAFYKYQSWNEILWLARSCGGMNLIRNYKCNAFHFVSNHRNSWKSTQRAAKCSTSHFSMKSREIPCSYVLCANEMEIFFFFPPCTVEWTPFYFVRWLRKKKPNGGRGVNFKYVPGAWWFYFLQPIRRSKSNPKLVGRGYLRSEPPKCTELACG